MHSFLFAYLPSLALGAVVFHATRLARRNRSGARVVKYSKEDIVPVRAKLRFSTLIVLPENEEILDFTTGDKEFWIINGAHNLCYVHPAQAGIRSNLNLITASGHVYSFLLTEISNDPNAEPDLKIFIEPKEGSGFRGNTALHGYVSAGEAEAYKKELETLRSQTADQIREAQAQSAEQINNFRVQLPTKLHFDYSSIESRAGPVPGFGDLPRRHFTYIQCAAREKPALYEIKDGKPNLINFQVENGVYIAPKIIDNGYLAVGKKKLTFARHVPRSKEPAMNNEPTRTSRESTEAPGPSPEERPILADYRPRVPDGRHHVAYRREEAADPSQSKFLRRSPSQAPLEVNETKIAELQNRIQELQREQLVAQNALTQQTRLLGVRRPARFAATASNRASPASRRNQRAEDAIQAERKRRAYVSLFASNVALSYRKTAPATPPAPLEPEALAAAAQNLVPVGTGRTHRSHNS